MAGEMPWPRPERPRRRGRGTTVATAAHSHPSRARHNAVCRPHRPKRGLANSTENPRPMHAKVGSLWPAQSHFGCPFTGRLCWVTAMVNWPERVDSVTKRDELQRSAAPDPLCAGVGWSTIKTSAAQICSACPGAGPVAPVIAGTSPTGADRQHQPRSAVSPSFRPSCQCRTPDCARLMSRPPRRRPRPLRERWCGAPRRSVPHR